MGMIETWSDDSTRIDMPDGAVNYAPENRAVILQHEFANKVKFRYQGRVFLTDENGNPIKHQALMAESFKAAVRAALDADAIGFEGAAKTAAAEKTKTAEAKS